MPHTINARSLEVIGRNAVAIREQCNAILAIIADIQDCADRRGGASEGMAAAEHAEDLHEASENGAQPPNPDAPAGAPSAAVVTSQVSRVLTRGDIRTTPSGERVIRPTFGKPHGEPLSERSQSTEETKQ